MSITVLHPGMLTTIQDQGRTGYQQFGVPVSGAVDPRSAAVANILAGNEEGEAVLECTVMGPQLRFDEPAVIAISGADLGPTLDGVPMDNYRAVRVGAGQVLRFTGPRCGCRAFIAVAGGLDVAEVMGSRSTYMKAKIGGFKGRKLEKEDVLNLRAPGAEPKALEGRSIAPEFRARAEYTLRVVLGPQDDAFTAAGIETFLTGVYAVTAEFDRMGCRMEGPEIAHETSGDIISDGIAFGAIQVPSSGQPIVMLADRQTTGGYTKIANVISADFRVLGQLKSGDKVRFEKISLSAAQEALLAQRASLRLLRHVLDG
ncbi:KipI antagonist [bioreactor metagenome]|uniref:KipI antagonist n=1 Tax=bioreactor metagenome TaxID=1076179 RepID=A0A644Z8L5_9ZZZZ